MMIRSSTYAAFWALCLFSPASLAVKSSEDAIAKRSDQKVIGLGYNKERHAAACPDYKHYAMVQHRPFSTGPLALPFQRPAPHCRTFSSPLVDQIIESMTDKMKDKDLARLFENAFPNTLDTTVKWHTDGTDQSTQHKKPSDGSWLGPQSFIVTGDINAEWLRDSANQLAQYQNIAKRDKNIESLILGAINTQAEFVIEAPYCNAFQPPSMSGEPIPSNGQDDIVHPAYEPSKVFECKYELDSLAHFLALGNTFANTTGSKAHLTPRYFTALERLLEVLDEQSMPTFDETNGKFRRNQYTFRRRTTLGTETLNLGGIGNPLAAGTGLVRSAFRPSDDATILGFFIPANAQIAVELRRTANIVNAYGKADLAKTMLARSETIEKGIWEHGVVDHKVYGKVFAFEVDGYGSTILMDDANTPSLLSLPLLGFVDRSDVTYKNTRKMIHDIQGNPYFLKGKSFSGIGGPHVGPQHAWPMSRLIQASTSGDDEEILKSLEDVRDVSKLGLVHEGVNVWRPSDFTRPWFAWANSVFSQVILDLAQRKPHLLFGEGTAPLEI